MIRDLSSLLKLHIFYSLLKTDPCILDQFSLKYYLYTKEEVINHQLFLHSVYFQIFLKFFCWLLINIHHFYFLKLKCSTSMHTIKEKANIRTKKVKIIQSEKHRWIAREYDENMVQIVWEEYGKCVLER